VKEYTLDPAALGLAVCRPEDLHGGSPEQSAVILRQILRGEGGPARDVVLLNSGAALYVGGAVSSIKDGMRVAAESIDSGKAQQKLEQLVEMTNAA